MLIPIAPPASNTEEIKQDTFIVEELNEWLNEDVA